MGPCDQTDTANMILDHLLFEPIVTTYKPL